MRKSDREPEKGFSGLEHVVVVYEPEAIKAVMIPCQARAL
jgi:hypothetical protein